MDLTARALGSTLGIKNVTPVTASTTEREGNSMHDEENGAVVERKWHACSDPVDLPELERVCP